MKPTLDQVTACVYCGGLFANALYAEDHEGPCGVQFAARVGLQVADPPRHPRRIEREPMLEI